MDLACSAVHPGPFASGVVMFCTRGPAARPPCSVQFYFANREFDGRAPLVLIFLHAVPLCYKLVSLLYMPEQRSIVKKKNKRSIMCVEFLLYMLAMRCVYVCSTPHRSCGFLESNLCCRMWLFHLYFVCLQCGVCMFAVHSCGFPCKNIPFIKTIKNHHRSLFLFTCSPLASSL